MKWAILRFPVYGLPRGLLRPVKQDKQARRQAFNPTTISYQLPDVGAQYLVSLHIYDILGREVIAMKKEQTAGYYEQRIDASNLSSGVYVYRIHAQPMNGGKSYISTKKMVVMK